VVIPTYNERQNISTLIQAIHHSVPELNVLVVDDNSPDGTALEVLELKCTLGDKVSLYSRAQKDGLARAYAAGFKEALRRGHDVISVPIVLLNFFSGMATTSLTGRALAPHRKLGLRLLLAPLGAPGPPPSPMAARA
jgi:hypothetical protein